MPISQPVLAGIGWTSGSHGKPRAYSAGGKSGVGSGRWAPTVRYCSSGDGDTLVDPASGILE